MSNKDIAEYVFKGIITVLLSIGLLIFKDFDQALDDMQRSVNRLNVSFATMSEKLVNQSRANDKFDRRLDKLEEGFKGGWTKDDHNKFNSYLNSLTK